MADGKRFVIKCRLVYLYSYHGSLTIPCTKCLENVGSRGSGVGIPYTTPLGSKVPGSVSSEICDNFFLINIFTCGFLQHVSHR